MDEIIRTESVSKRFGKVGAVNEISISVRKGEIYGFLGLNGAGKTTTIRMLLGLIHPSSGAAYLNGKPIRSQKGVFWNSVGYLVEIPYAYPDLTVRENLELIRRLRMIPDAKAVDDAIEKLHLGEYRDRLARNLSQGNAQRLGLAKAIIHKPEILILDEPANGLDPAGIVEIRELIGEMSERDGVTIFISSHILGEVSKFASRIGIIHNGRLIQEVGIEELDLFRHRCLRLKTFHPERTKSTLAQKGFEALITQTGELELTQPECLMHPEKIAEILVHSGNAPTMLQVEEEDLESYFLRTIGMDGGVK